MRFDKVLRSIMIFWWIFFIKFISYMNNLLFDWQLVSGLWCVKRWEIEKNKCRGVIQTVIHACHRFYWSRRLKKLSMGVSHCLAKYFYCEHRLACDRFFHKCEWVCFSKICNFKCKDVFELLKITRNSSM